jgi:D-alanine-D-alanine ligase
MENKIKVAVLVGGPGQKEHETSLDIGEQILKNIDKEKYEASKVEINKEGVWEVNSKDIKKDFNIVFIALCGRYGEGGFIQGELEEVGVPYTGSDSQASALCMNKYLSLKLLQDAGLDIPQTFFLSRRDWEENEEAVVQKAKLFVDPPYVIKPNRSGNSFDMVITSNSKDIRPTLEKLFERYRDLIIQPFIDGREATCAVLDDGTGGSAYPLSPTEVVPKLTHFYDYDSKYKIGSVDEITPAPFSDAWLWKVKQIAKQAHTTLGCRGFSRVDMIIGKEKVYVLEVNTIPGLGEANVLVKEAKDKKISYPNLIDRIIQSGLMGNRKNLE